MTTTFQMRTSWADDDSVHSFDSTDPIITAGSAAPSTPGTAKGSGGGGGGENRRDGGDRCAVFRVSYVKHPSTYARHLFDVDGHLLTDEDGRPVNVFTAKMNDLLTQKKIVCFHKPGRPGYRYFCTSKNQAEQFRRARDKGFTKVLQPYHVYPDEPGCVLPHEGKYLEPTAP